jgi:hypothetical protein
MNRLLYAVRRRYAWVVTDEVRQRFERIEAELAAVEALVAGDNAQMAEVHTRMWGLAARFGHSSDHQHHLTMANLEADLAARAADAVKIRALAETAVRRGRRRDGMDEGPAQ